MAFQRIATILIATKRLTVGLPTFAAASHAEAMRDADYIFAMSITAITAMPIMTTKKRTVCASAAPKMKNPLNLSQNIQDGSNLKKLMRAGRNGERNGRGT